MTLTSLPRVAISDVKKVFTVNGAPFTGIGGVTETDAAGGTKDVEIRDTQTVGSAARRFMRVRAER